MSRGLGKVERQVRELFKSDPSTRLDSIAVTVRIHGKQATQSQYSSTRRALNNLQKKALLTRLESGWFGRSFYALPEQAEEYSRRVARERAHLRSLFGRG